VGFEQRLRLARWLVLFGFVATASNYAWSESPSSGKDREVDVPPSSFYVYSKSGNEGLHGTCEEKDGSHNMVTCSFEDIQIVPPNLKKIDKEMRELQDAAAHQPAESLSPSDRSAIEAKITDPNTGPKAKEYLKQLLTADPRIVAKAYENRRKHTCGMFMQTFTLDFKKIGPSKWYSDPGPSGFCNSVSVYELTGEPDEAKDRVRVLWTLSQRVVAAGKTDGPFCAGVYPAHLNEVETFSWKNPDEFELPCDFIKHGLP